MTVRVTMQDETVREIQATQWHTDGDWIVFTTSNGARVTKVQQLRSMLVKEIAQA